MSIRDTKYDIVTNSGNTIANTATETAFFNSFIWRANQDANSRSLHYKLAYKGFYSSMAGTPGTLTFRLRWGSAAFTSPSTTTLIAASNPITLPASQSNQLWTLDLDFTVRNRGTGTNGKVVAIGRPMLNWGSVPIIDQMPAIGSDASISLDTTLEAKITLTAQFSTADASNSIILTDPSSITYE